MNQGEWEALTRTRLGSPSTSDFPAELVAEAVLGALREYGRYIGPRALTELASVKDQPNYPVPAGAVLVIDVFWNLGGGPAIDLFDPEWLLVQGLQLSPGVGFDLVENPSLLVAFYQKLEGLHRRFEGRWEATPGPTGSGQELWLEPPPTTTDDKIWVLYRKALTVGQVPARDEETFLSACLWKAYDMRGNRLSVVTSTSVGGGSVNFGGEIFNKKAEAARKEFMARMPPVPTIVR